LLVFNKSADASIISFFCFFAEKTAGDLVHAAMICNAITAFVAFVARVGAGAGVFIVAVAHNFLRLNGCLYCNYFV
jgi:hypothetical protein